MKTLSLLIMVMTLAACAQKEDPCLDIPTQDTSKPGILIIGDSISIGYTPYVRDELSDYSVVHTTCNAQSTTNGLKHIDEWLEYRKHWALVTINHGYWDIPPNPEAVGLEAYAANLRLEVSKAKAHSDRVIFLTTTAVILDWHPFTNEDVDRYNTVALQVMQELNVEVIDLNQVSKTIPTRDDSKIHFTEAGSEILASSIAIAIKSF